MNVKICDENREIRQSVSAHACYYIKLFEYMDLTGSSSDNFLLDILECMLRPISERQGCERGKIKNT